MIKKICIVATLLSTSFVFANGASDFQPEYDETTRYIINWSDYEAECRAKGMDPLYEDYENLYTGHCDFEALEWEGINEEEELRKLMGGEND